MNYQLNISTVKTWNLTSIWWLFVLIITMGCQQTNDEVLDFEIEEFVEEDPDEVSYLLPEIDLSNWKVTLPIGRPDEVKPPEILDYGTNEKLAPFMYNDSVNGALVFYTYPGASTTNSSYSRTELRELINPADGGKTNWTFEEGGTIRGTLSMDEISKDDDGDYHRTIIMQIHGRLTDQQRDLIGEDDNNAPPMLKIYWNNGFVRVKTKVLKDLNVSDTEILSTDAWTDDDGYTFPLEVGFDKFTLEVRVSSGRMEVILNDEYTRIYDDIHVEKWGVFENYFKAGNYLITRDADSYAKLKYYDLVVNH